MFWKAEAQLFPISIMFIYEICFPRSLFIGFFLNHLDALGDLYLAGAAIIGGFQGTCSGHAATNMLLKSLFADPEAWKLDVLQGPEALSAIDGGIYPELAETA